MINAWVFAATLLFAAQSAAQEASVEPAPLPVVLSTPLPAEGGSALPFRSAVAGAEATAFAAQTRSELEFTLAPIPLADLETRAQSALGYLQTVATALSTLIIEGERLSNSGSLEADREQDLRSRGELLFEFRNELAVRLTILIDAAEAKGADLTESRTYVNVVTNVDLPEQIPGRGTQWRRTGGTAGDSTCSRGTTGSRTSRPLDDPRGRTC